MTCPKCSAAVPPDATECPSCGVQLAKARTAALAAKPATKAPTRQGSRMPVAFGVLGIVAALYSAMIWEAAPSSIQQLGALLVALLAAVLFVGAAVVGRLDRLVGAAERAPR